MKQDFGRAAASYDAAAALARETGRRMAEGLDLVRLAPTRLADIGCATGDGLRALQGRYPEAQALAIDFAYPMLQEVRHRVPWHARLRRRRPMALAADVRALPLASASLGLIWSNLMLHWLDDPLPAWRELHRVLHSGGLLMFSMLGPGTLGELRRSAAALDMQLPLRRFHDMHDIGDMLVATGFSDPVMQMEELTLTYATVRALLRDQRLLGTRDGLLGQLPWRQWRQVFAHYERTRVAGRLAVTFEIVYGHAWKSAPSKADDGRAVIRFTPRRTP